MTGKRKEPLKATFAQIDFIVKLKCSTGDKEEIPIPLYMDKAGEMIDRLKVLRDTRKRSISWDFSYLQDAQNESYWSAHMWACD